MRSAKTILRLWLPIALITTAVSGLVYAAVQQTLRQSANDPQIQLAEDAADMLAQGETAESVVPANEVDVAHSLAPFIIVFNDKGDVLASSGLLRGQAPVLPEGVLDYVKQNGEDRITWQAEPGVRIATVVVNYGGPNPGYVLAGRSLREIEKREGQAEMFAGVTWLGTLTLSLVVIGLSELYLVV